ncbi:hypothetical protein KYTH09_01680 [Helicobacter pylori]
MTKFFQNDKKTLSCYNALNTFQCKCIPMYEIPNTNNLIQKERSLNLFLSRFHYTLSINKFQYNIRSCFFYNFVKD